MVFTKVTKFHRKINYIKMYTIVLQYNKIIIVKQNMWWHTLTGRWAYRVFSHDVTAAIFLSHNNETAAMLVSQTNPVGVELFSYANAFFCCNKFAQMLATWLKTLYMTQLFSSKSFMTTLQFTSTPFWRRNMVQLIPFAIFCNNSPTIFKNLYCRWSFTKHRL